LKDFKDNTDIKDVIILIAMPLVDVYGKKTTDVVVNMTFSDETRKKKTGVTLFSKTFLMLLIYI
jgi:hypothetical protein